jgi:hypothetical protein
MVDGIPISATCPDERERDENVARALRHDREHEVLRDAYCKAQDENARLKAIHATWGEWFGHLREVIYEGGPEELVRLRADVERLTQERDRLLTETDMLRAKLCRLNTEPTRIPG